MTRLRLLVLPAVLVLAVPSVPSATGAAASSCLGHAVTIEGQPNTTITGTPGDDVIVAPYGGRGSVHAGAGDDLVCLVPGATGVVSYAVKGGPGTDTVVLAVEVDIEVKLDRAATWTEDDQTSDVGLGGFENAVVSGARVVVYGTKADNRLVARSTTGALLTGKEGDDHLRLGLVVGGDNHDGLRLASGGPGDDVLIGSERRDVLTGGTGRDKAVGRAGKDVCTAEVRRSCELS